jgi:phosphatidylserine/phosphatidylglycerophosphate/cardiolipin synthase-like enzyme
MWKKRVWVGGSLLAGSVACSGGVSSGGGVTEGSVSTSDLRFTSDVQIIVEPGDDAAGLVRAIRGARTSVHVEMYLLTSTPVMEALISRAAAGLQVEVLLNETFPSSGADSASNASSFRALESAGVDVKWAPASFTYTHEKAVIVDGRVAWIMTMNATRSSATDNREYLAVDSDAADVAEAEQIFAADFASRSLRPRGKLVVSPTNSQDELVSLLQMARRTIDVEAEELSDTAIVGALTAAAQRGVKVRVVLADASSTPRAPTLKAAGVALVTYGALYVHAKSVVVDGAYAYVGSQNFTAGSLDDNRELGVLTDTASEVSKVETTTSSDFANGTRL